MATAKSKAELRSQLRKKDYAVKQFGGKCQFCGYSKCIAALDFHHVIKSGKKHKPSSIIRRLKWEVALEELRKCILICSNCHRELHYSNENLDLKNYLSEWFKNSCEFCKVEFLSKSEPRKYCSNECSAYSQRKVTRPSMEELQTLLNSGFSKRRLGKMFGVSDVTVGKLVKNK